MNILVKCLLVIASCALLLSPIGCAPYAYSKVVKKVDSKARLQVAIQEAKEREVHVKPALTLLVKGDYAKAREGFEQLEADRVGRFGWQRVRCLLAEGKIDEGMRILSTLRLGDISAVDQNNLRVALAVKGGREADLVAALQNVEALPSFDAAPDGRNAVNPSPSVPDRLLAVAGDFGRKYDRETLHLVGSEALRRGQVDPSALAEYASITASNGDLQKAKSLWERVLTYKVSDMLRLHARGSIYDIANYIALAERNHPVEVEEQNIREKRRSTFFLASWQ